MNESNQGLILACAVDTVQLLSTFLIFIINIQIIVHVSSKPFCQNKFSISAWQHHERKMIIFYSLTDISKIIPINEATLE